MVRAFKGGNHKNDGSQSLSFSTSKETNPDMYATIYKTWLKFAIYISQHVKAVLPFYGYI